MTTSRWVQATIAVVTIAVSTMSAGRNSAATMDPSTDGGWRTVKFDRAALHRQATEESLHPIHPGVPGEQAFWNTKARSFMYAPAFDFKPVEGAAQYRFSVVAYGTRSWRFNTTSPNASLQPIWSELPSGRLLAELKPLDAKGNVRWAAQDIPPSRWFVKDAASIQAPSLDFPPIKDAPKYRITVWAARELEFEADDPWAPLSPIWKEVPVGEVVLKVEGLDAKGGSALGLATIDWSRHEQNRVFRRFHRKAVFHGPYHEAAAEYRQSGYTWLRWLAANDFARWRKEGDPKKLEGYPSKFIGAAISGMTALASLEPNASQKKEYLRMATNAARTLMAASFPDDWGLPNFPPTYSDEIGTVMMHYPAGVGRSYLDLFEATGNKAALDAAQKIADTYRKTQLPDGSWPLLMDAKSGERTPRSQADLLPNLPLDLFERLIDQYGFDRYQPMADAAWRRIREDTLTTFRFEGQFEDTGREGRLAGNQAGGPACFLVRYLLRHSRRNPSYVALAEEVLRFAEDQFVVWEQPVESDVSQMHFREIPFTPFALEQYVYMVPISGSAANFVEAYQAAYEATGNELYLAKAVAFANAMTVLQQKNGGRYVGTYWNPGQPGGWPNVHQYTARVLVELGDFLRRHRLRVSVATEGRGARNIGRQMQ